MMIQKEMIKKEKEMGGQLKALFGALSGDQKKADALDNLDLMKEKGIQIRDFFWMLVKERFAEAFSGEKVTGFRIDHQFQVWTKIGEKCPGCGGYHKKEE